MHFSISDLSLFVRVAELENLTKGAERASLSAAAASARIKSLEGQLNASLFYRQHRGVKLTTAGETLLRHARVILDQVDRLENEFALNAAASIDSAVTEAGHIRVFANTTAVTEFMPKLLADYLAERPNVSVDLRERITSDVVRGVREGNADVGIVAGPVVTTGLQSWCFAKDRLVVVTPEHHVLAGHRSVISLAEALEYDHVCMDEGHTLHTFLKEKARQARRKIACRLQTRTYEAMCRMIEAGVGIGILPESTVLRYRKSMRLEVLTLTDAWAIRERKLLVREIEVMPGYARALVNAVLRLGEDPPAK